MTPIFFQGMYFKYSVTETIKHNVIIIVNVNKVSKGAKIRNRQNQIPHLIQNIESESDINTREHNIQASQEVSPFPAGDHKASMKRRPFGNLVHVAAGKVFTI